MNITYDIKGGLKVPSLDKQQQSERFYYLYMHFQESIRELQSKQAEAGQKEATPTIETFDFKAKFAETKAYAKVCIQIWYFYLSKYI